MRAAVLCSLVLTGAALAWEDPATMHDPAEAAGEQPPGRWQGNWTLLRDDPRLHSLGGQTLLRLHILHSRDEPLAQLQWVAGRALCPDPLAPPCEWVGAAGQETAVADEGGLYAVLSVSADPDDPFVLHLRPDGRGLLFNRRAALRLRFDYRTEAP